MTIPENIIIIETFESAIAELQRGNGLLYEFLKEGKYHRCWVIQTPINQQVKTYIDLSVFWKMLGQDVIRQYDREETDDYIRLYYI